MPCNGDWKKPFRAGLEMVRGSETMALRLCCEQILRLARKDGMIEDPAATVPLTLKSGRKFLLYKETPAMNRYMRKRKNPRKVFHQTKFVSRTGELAKAFNMGAARIEDRDGKVSAIFRFEGHAEAALRGGDSKLSRNLVSVAGADGSVLAVQTERGRRRPLELASRKAARVYEKELQAGLDIGVRRIN